MVQVLQCRLCVVEAYPFIAVAQCRKHGLHQKLIVRVIFYYNNFSIFIHGDNAYVSRYNLIK